MSIYATDFPLINKTFPENVVTQGHVDYCQDNGHASWDVDGINQGICPRCGARTVK